ncbi:cytidylyltransferase domain-containing protein [Chlorobium ferrooxidans]|nr:glycosyltransferase family protein [Chlorobium ferrooxidans]
MKQRENEKVVAIVEARMTSSRLPGKHLLPADGKPMLSHLIARLKAVPDIDEIVIATTTNADDDVLEQLAIRENTGVFRGSEEDVMGRVLQSARAYNAQVICEVTGDCPIIDPMLVEQVIKTYYANSRAQYVNIGNFGMPDGMGAQVFSTEVLAKSESMTDEPLDREHVTMHILRNPELFPPIYLVPFRTHYWPGLGLTLDEKRDYELLKRIIEHFGDENPLFSCSDVLQLLKEKPEWVAINHEVRRKGNT